MKKLAMALAPLAILAQTADAQQGRGRTEPVVQVHEREVRDVDGGAASTADSKGLGQPGPRNVLGKIILVPTPQPQRRMHGIGRDDVNVLSGASASTSAGSGGEALAQLSARNAVEPAPGSGPAISGRFGGKLAGAGERSVIGGGGHAPSPFQRFGERSDAASSSATSAFRALGGEDRTALGGGSSSGAFRRFGGEGRSAVGGGASSEDVFRSLARQPLAGGSEELVLGGGTGEAYPVQVFGRSGTTYALALSPQVPNTDPYVFLARGYLFGEDPNETPRSIFLRVPAGMRVVLIPLQGA